MKLRSGSVRVVLIAVACVAGAACGARFEAKERGEGGSGGDAGAVTETNGGEPGAGGEESSGGKPTSGGMGGGGKGGATPVAGKGGTGGAGGIPGVGGLGGVGGFGGQPQSLPISDDGLELWFRADVGVHVDGGVVTSWDDGSGHARHASQIAANYAPKLMEDALNGKPAVVFDGNDDSMELPVMENDFSQGVSAFMVVHAKQQEAGCQGYFELSNGGEMEDIHLGDYRGSLLYEVANPYLNDLMYPVLFNRPIITVAVHDPDGFARVRQNGNGAGEMTGMALPVPGKRSRNYLGLSLYADCVPMKGSISELALFSRAVTNAELVKMEAYLREKWACCAADP